MKKKYILDIVITITLLLLMRIKFLNFNLHELIGLLTLILFIVHKFFNYKIIIQTIKKWKLFNIKTKLGFILDVILFIIFLFMIISSIMISNKIFGFLNIESGNIWSDIHHLSAYLMFIVISIHIGFHYKSLLLLVEKKLKVKNTKTKKYLYIFISIMIMLFGFKVMLNNNFYMYLLKPFGYKEKTEEKIIESDINTDKISLDEYLKDKHCDGCSRHCLLTNLRCSNGQIYLQKAIDEYNKLYNIEKENTNIKIELNVLDYFLVMTAIVSTTHYILKVKKIN